MAIRTDAQLKQFFETSDIPTQQQFFDFIDSKLNVINPLPAVAIGGAITGATIGSVLFVGAGGTLQQNNPNYYWDNTNNRLGFGTITPQSKIHLFADTNSDATRLEQRFERPVGSVNTNTSWGNFSAYQNGVRVGFFGLAQQQSGQGTRYSWATTNSLAVGATESMRLSQEKRLSVGSVLGNGATIDAFSAGLLSTDLAIRVRNNGNTFDDFKVNGAGQTQIGNGATISTSALLQLDSVSRGLLIPRMTTAQRNAIVSPADGLFIWNTTTSELNVWKTSTASWRRYNDLP
jgi:hypothetical protein